MIDSLNTETRLRHIAIIGNPNAGKTTIFNALTGMRQKVGNYPGVTVEKKEGRIVFNDGSEAVLLDLPGTYSLTVNAKDLFAADPLVFKRLIYEMRFDQVSALYALFGSFYVGLRVPAAELGRLLNF